MKLLLLLMPSTLFELQGTIKWHKWHAATLGYAAKLQLDSPSLLYFCSSLPAPCQKARHRRFARLPLKFKSKKTPNAPSSFQKNKIKWVQKMSPSRRFCPITVADPWCLWCRANCTAALRDGRRPTLHPAACSAAEEPGRSPQFSVQAFMSQTH